MQIVSNAAVAGHFSDILTDLGGISSERVYRSPEPGRATIEDLLRKNENGGMCELIDLAELFAELDRHPPASR